jgi:hypothetical protein
MRLPHIDEAHVPEAKLSGYLLAADHASGRSKALFLHKLGFRRDQPDVLRRALLQHAADYAVSSVQLTPFGAKYLIEGQISGHAEMTIREHDLVVLTADIPEENLKQGDVGTVVLIHQAGAGFEVEFATLAGETLAVVTVPANAVRPVGDKEIAHVRRVA